MSSYKTTVGIVFGGNSEEHFVSISSAKTIINALRSGPNLNKYKIMPFYIDQEGRWFSLEESETFLNNSNSNKIEPDSSKPIGLTCLPENIKDVDIWFPILHGPNGEDGSIQGLFRLMRKPFVGSGVLGSALGMDKVAMKCAFKDFGLKQVPYTFIESDQLNREDQVVKILKEIESNLGYPCFIKPANLGSSVGITKAFNSEDLIYGLNKAANLDKRIICEQNVIARELECAVFGKKRLQASVVGEICFNSDWYDYETKYSEGQSKALIPAPIPNSVSIEVKKQAIEACKAINAYGLARVDFFYEEDCNSLWINEINTIPGFTAKSMYPMLWEASGVTLQELLSKLVDTARE